MENDTRNGLPTIWQHESMTPVGVSLGHLRRKARRLEERIRWRNLREYAVGALVVGIFGYYMWRFPAPLVRIGCSLTVAGVLFVVGSLHKRGAARTAPVEMALSPCLEFYRKQLERQRDLLRDVWKWYLLPLVPGLAVFLAGLMLWTLELPNATAHRPVIVWAFALTATVCGLVLLAVGRLNQWVARRLQREIDALAALEEHS